MNLIEKMMEKCVLYDETSTPDGAGGFTTEYVAGVEFMAAITTDTTLEAEIAKKQGVSSVYTVTTKQNAAPPYNRIFKRVSDGQFFRVTSDPSDKKSPEHLDICQVKAARWTT